ncbi:hypothetical protein BC936DRAFT_144905 [Jimgerdemannia flammicorona]|uniref:Uncharacterized protein n=2 Tax=Jimgerdemannia flammicorona TaxID=994334 RepID=A0A433QRE8_9FUNG|nr:hypothetical protein BC936DRAFT_144905 [Jimgerdemannia flammicorona]RUS32364.1 hypothetical protein BC938DRAFT_475599 [Jimgerdemannia flammicorona]
METFRPLTLYATCLHTLVQYSDQVASLDGAGYDPYGRDIIDATLAHPHLITPNIFALLYVHYGPEILAHHLTASSLVLSKLRLDDHQLARLNSIGPFLTRLNLSESDISDDSLRHLNTLTALSVLDLSRNRITDLGVLYIAIPVLSNASNITSTHRRTTKTVSAGMSRLRFLSLSDNPMITHLSLVVLKYFDQLMALDLSVTAVEVRDALTLMQATDPCWKSLPEDAFIFPSSAASVWYTPCCVVADSIGGEPNIAAQLWPAPEERDGLFRFVVGQSASRHVRNVFGADLLRIVFGDVASYEAMEKAREIARTDRPPVRLVRDSVARTKLPVMPQNPKPVQILGKRHRSDTLT